MKKKDLKKEHLVKAARRIFGKFGFEKATMSEIAQEARKGKSSLYYYFASKDDVFKAVIEYEAEILKDKIGSEVEKHQDVVEKFRAYLTVRFTGIKELGNLYNALRNDLLSHLEFVGIARENYDKYEFEYISKLLVEGTQQGVFQIEDLEDTAGTLQMAIKALELPLLFDYETEVFDSKFNSLFNLLFNGLKKR